MPFDQSPIAEVRVGREDADLAVSWTLSGGPRTAQVYVDRALAWHGTETGCLLPWPGGPVAIDVGVVAPGEEEIDFGGSLPAAPATHARLTWLGGTFESDTLAGFRVYMGPTAGAAADLTRPAAEINAFPLGIINDGFGRGGFGEGGFGRAASRYSWRSGSLSGGVWSFAVRPFDEAGNEGDARLASVTIDAPPRPPAASARGLRLFYTYDETTMTVTLSWNPSPT